MFRTVFTTLTAPLKSGLCATQLCIRSDTASSSKSERVTPKKAKLNPEKEEDLAVVKCNMRLLKAWASETKLLPYWLIDCLDVDLNKSKCIINQLSIFWLSFSAFLLSRHFDLLTEDFMSGRLENNRIWGPLLKDLKQPTGKQLTGKNPKLGNFEKQFGSGLGSKEKFR